MMNFLKLTLHSGRGETVIDRKFKVACDNSIKANREPQYLRLPKGQNTFIFGFSFRLPLRFEVGRRQYWVNNPSGGQRFAYALHYACGLMVFAGIAWLILYCNSDKKLNLQAAAAIAFGIGTTIGAAYWAIDAAYGRQWTYCAGIYNEYLKSISGSNSQTEIKMELFAASLALDLIDVHMWAHRTFAIFFKTILAEAIEDIDSEEEKTAVKHLAKTCHLRSDQAYYYILKHQERLFGELEETFDRSSNSERTNKFIGLRAARHSKVRRPSLQKIKAPAVRPAPLLSW